MKKANQLTIEDASYIAGLFDGEGCVHLSSTSWKDCPCFRTPTSYLRLSITNTNKEIVQWLIATVDGKMHEVKRTGKCKTCYVWTINGLNSVDFVKQIYPYLKIKRLQAEIAIKFGETIRNKTSGINPRLDPTTNQVRKKLFDELKVLNYRGTGQYKI